MRNIPNKLVLGAAFCIITFCLTLATATAADVLLIEKVEQASLRDLPGNGLTKQQVEALYGEPLVRRRAVGDPPISRWEYDGFNVYFEYDLVIESVLDSSAVVGDESP